MFAAVSRDDAKLDIALGESSGRMRVRDVLLEARPVVGMNDPFHQLWVGKELVFAVAAQALAGGGDLHDHTLRIQAVFPTQSQAGVL